MIPAAATRESVRVDLPARNDRSVRLGAAGQEGVASPITPLERLHAPFLTHSHTPRVQSVKTACESGSSRRILDRD